MQWLTNKPVEKDSNAQSRLMFSQKQYKNAYVLGKVSNINITVTCNVNLTEIILIMTFELDSRLQFQIPLRWNCTDVSRLPR